MYEVKFEFADRWWKRIYSARDYSGICMYSLGSKIFFLSSFSSIIFFLFLFPLTFTWNDAFIQKENEMKNKFWGILWWKMSFSHAVYTYCKAEKQEREVTSKGTMLMIPNVGRGKKVILNGQKKDDGWGKTKT